MKKIVKKIDGLVMQNGPFGGNIEISRGKSTSKSEAEEPPASNVRS